MGMVCGQVQPRTARWQEKNSESDISPTFKTEIKFQIFRIILYSDKGNGTVWFSLFNQKELS